jgi:hypothetical protein
MPSRERYQRERAAAATRGSTPHKERVDRVQRIAPDTTRSQAGGHPAPGEQPLSIVFGPGYASLPLFVETPEGGGRVLQVDDLSRNEAHRVGRHLAMLQALQQGRLAPDEFRRRARRMRPVREHRLVSDPRVALTLVIRTDARDFQYESGRRRPRRPRRPT